jgi:condensin complex subunit 2
MSVIASPSSQLESVKLDYSSLYERTLQSERLADFKFSANVTDQPVSGGKSLYGGEDELDSEDEAAFQNPPTAGDAMDIVEDAGAEHGAGPQEPQDFFAGNDAVNDYDGFGADQGYGDAEGDHSGEMDGDEEGRETTGGPSRPAPFDPRRVPDQRELVMAMTEDGGVSMMDYFDSSVVKNWAGPEHWKLRKVIRKRKSKLMFWKLSFS